MLARELAALYARDLVRLRQQVDAFPGTASLWATGPGVTNAAGTLVLHLDGNLREYVGRQLGGMHYERDRPAEFSTRDLAQAELSRRAQALADVIPGVIGRLSDADLSATFPEVVLGVPLSSRQFLVHLSGHLNYHLGQIDYLRRLTTGEGAIALAGLTG
jgi:uncharacterized damage-inducible protein DinB